MGTDPTMLDDEQRDKLAEGWCIVAWRDDKGDHWEHGDDAQVWHRACSLPPGVRVWVNGYEVTHAW